MEDGFEMCVVVQSAAARERDETAEAGSDEGQPTISAIVHVA